MSRSAHLPVLVFIATALWLQPVTADRPNIILMMADDMGMGDTSAFQDVTGNGDDVQLHTPHMERLARMGVRMTDAHTPSSRCSPTRYGLLTGRYPWRNRLKHWVLFGSQGDPMIEADRPTIATLLRAEGYSTAMFGKWHVGLRYRRSDGSPAAGWDDADLKQPLFTTPIDHGFDMARFTSRSHGTSGPDAGAKPPQKRSGPNQNIGPGHIHDRTAVGATGNGKQLVKDGPDAYVLSKLGSRHSDHAIDFLNHHVGDQASRGRPFFLYYPSNSNHSPYTPDQTIGGQKVFGAGQTKSGRSMDRRYDYVYENDVALGRLITWLETTEDPRNPGRKLIETTLVIFTSDNGAEINDDIATGPFRSHKGSCYEGGHRVPFIASWPAGAIGDGDPSTIGKTYDAPIGLQDLYATFAEIVEADLPDLRGGNKGAEDSYSILAALRGRPLPGRPPLFFNDHKEAENDPAVAAMRVDSPTVDGKVYPGKWKLFFDASLLRAGEANPYEMYDLAVDQWETNDLINEPSLQPLVKHLSAQALLHRTSGGHRIAALAPEQRVHLDWSSDSFKQMIDGKNLAEVVIHDEHRTVKATLRVNHSSSDVKGDLSKRTIVTTPHGIGILGGGSNQADDRESFLIQFDKDVIVESVAIVAGANGTCGGFYQVADAAPLAIYCVDADIDAKDQSGILSDIGVLHAGESLRLDSSPHYGVEAAGDWSFRSMTVRVLK
ncbi:MAG: arylsulfatase [Planctomycetales bacterium]|nr:arylsulfatase [Planctomycetales bacterium]